MSSRERQKWLLATAVILGMLIAYFFLSGSQEKEASAEVPRPAHEITDPFSKSFQPILEAYFHLNQGLVEGDTSSANSGARSLLAALGQVRLDLLKGDSTGTLAGLAKTYLEEIRKQADEFLLQNKLAAKRRVFSEMTDNVWDVVRTVRYPEQKLFYTHCPMAFNDSGANWVSAQREIRNPYFGKQMLECGKVMDSLDFSVR